MSTTTSYECGDMLKMNDVGTKEDCHPAAGSLTGIQGCVPMRNVAQQSYNGVVQNPNLDGVKERQNNTMHEVAQRLKHRSMK